MNQEMMKLYSEGTQKLLTFLLDSLVGEYQICLLTLSQTSPGFHVSTGNVFIKHWEKEKLLVMREEPFGELSAIEI